MDDQKEIPSAITNEILVGDLYAHNRCVGTKEYMRGWIEFKSPTDTIGKYRATYHGEHLRKLYKLLWNIYPEKLLSDRGATADKDFDDGKLINVPLCSDNTHQLFIRWDGYENNKI